MNLKIIFYIGLGGFLGAISRYGLSGMVHLLMGGRAGVFPVGTLVVNIIGCLILGFSAHGLNNRLEIDHALRVGLTVGFLGAFTTFSTFAYESLTLAQNGGVLLMGLNLFASNLLGFLAIWSGWRLGMFVC